MAGRRGRTSRLRESALAEATAGSSAGALERGGDGDGDEDEVTCPTCDGSGKIRGGSVECPDCDGTGKVPKDSDVLKESAICVVCESADCEVEGTERLREAELTAKGRKQIDKSNFAVPDKAPDSGSYPIHDLAHARNALARASGKPEEGQVKAAVYRAYPQLKPKPSKEAADLEERLTRLEGEVKQANALREAKPDYMGQTFGPMTRVKNSRGEQGYEVTLIREGTGNEQDGNWYTDAAIREMCESGRAEGMQAYSNHPTLEEEESRPERDVKELIGSHTDVRYVKEGIGKAKAVFVPLTTDEHHPHYGWVTTLAEAASRSSGPHPLVGWSLYGLSAGDEGKRPDGSEGRVVDLIMPTSGDMVTNAGAGGEFARKLMVESARRLRRANTNARKDDWSMFVDEYRSKLAEAHKRLREADTDEKRTAVWNEIEALEKDADKIEVPKAPESVEALTEAAPQLVAKIREAAKADSKDLEAQLKEATDKLKEAEGYIGQIADVRAIADTLREAGVEDETDIRYFVSQARSRGLREASDVKDLVETERAYQERQHQTLLDKMQESFELPEVEGVLVRRPESTEDGGLASLKESGIPTKEQAAA